MSRSTKRQVEEATAWVKTKYEAGEMPTYAEVMEQTGVAARTVYKIFNILGIRPQDDWHRITELNEETRQGVCSQCGPVKVWWQGGQKKRFACAVTMQSRNRGYSKRPHGLNNRQALELKAGRKCEVPVCDKPAQTVDHCHDLLNIRGVLCRDHNLALGYVHDSIEELEGLIDYLKMTTGVDGLARLGYAG